MGVVFIVSLFDDFWITWEVVLGGLVLLSILDGLWVNSFNAFSVQRLIPTTVSIFQRATVGLSVSHTYKLRIWVDIVDHVPPELNAEEKHNATWIGKGETVSFEYEIKPIQRGIHAIDSVGVLIRSPLTLWWRRRHIQVRNEVRVYPDFAVIARYLELLLEQRTNLLGLKQVQRRGSGLEFQQLRDYRQGDALNWIDWNATSKRRTLISRDFQDEKNQTLIFLLDTGRRLRSRDDDLTHFDHVLNAMVLLSYIALRQGDAVGALSFGLHNRWIPPVSGVASMKRLLNSVFDLDSGPVTSDYVDMAERLQLQHKKRAMVILLTNIRDEDYELNEALRMLRQRHFVVLANLREQMLDQLQDQSIESFDDALSAAGASQYLRERTYLQRKCAKSSNLVLDSLPQELHVNLANAYWSIKRAGRL